MRSSALHGCSSSRTSSAGSPRRSRCGWLQATDRRSAPRAFISRLLVPLQVDKAEYARATAVQQQWVAAERATADARWAANREHVGALLRQKDDAEAAKKAAFAALQEEGVKERAAQAAQLERLRVIREQKVAELLALGVDTAYTVQLAKFDPMAAISKDYERGPAKGRAGKAGGAGATGAGDPSKKK